MEGGRRTKVRRGALKRAPPALGYRRQGERGRILRRRRMIVLGEMLVHRSTGGVLMDLHEKLADHFAAKALAYRRELASRGGGAGFARQPHF